MTFLLVRAKPMTTDSNIAEFYRLGYSLKQVGNIVGLDKKTVRRHLVARGVPPRPSNNVKRSEWLTKPAKRQYGDS